MSSPRTGARHYWVALRAMLVLTVALGVAYPLVITGIGQLALPWQANGSTLTKDGEVVGSALIGQSFSDAEGNPLPQWFQPRPSAAGDGYDAGASSGSNWGPENPDLIAAIIERKQQIADFEGVDPESIPADALTSSSSGLDPHISVEYARLQLPRIAREHGISESELSALLESKIQTRELGFLGESTVNVLQLNLALDEAKG